MMTKLLTAAALFATLATPAIAKDAANEHRFTRDGETFVYTARASGDATILSGRSGSGRDFRLVVRNGRVTGKSGGVPVSFSVPKPARTPAWKSPRADPSRVSAKGPSERSGGPFRIPPSEFPLKSFGQIHRADHLAIARHRHSDRSSRR